MINAVRKVPIDSEACGGSDRSRQSELHSVYSRKIDGGGSIKLPKPTGARTMITQTVEELITDHVTLDVEGCAGILLDPPYQRNVYPRLPDEAKVANRPLWKRGNANHQQSVGHRCPGLSD